MKTQAARAATTTTTEPDLLAQMLAQPEPVRRRRPTLAEMPPMFIGESMIGLDVAAYQAPKPPPLTAKELAAELFAGTRDRDRPMTATEVWDGRDVSKDRRVCICGDGTCRVGPFTRR